MSSVRNLLCPCCSKHLVIKNRGGIELDVCPDCQGMWLDAGELKQVLGKGFCYDRLIKNFEMKGDGKICPCCGEKTCLMSFASRHVRFEIDHCLKCQGFWLDRGELEKLICADMLLAGRAPSMLRAVPSPQSSKLYQAQEHYKLLHQEGKSEEISHDLAVDLFCIFTQIPREVYNPRCFFPVMLLSLVSINILMFFALLYSSSSVRTLLFLTYGMIPSDIFSFSGILSLFTYSLLHVSAGHLILNMYLIWIFGDNVSDVFMDHGKIKGSALFFLFYLTLSICAALPHAAYASLFPVMKTVPLVGAGGIASGMIGAYCRLFPKTWLFQAATFFTLKIPVWFYLVFWALTNIFICLYYRVDSAISLPFHLGGLITGYFLVSLFIPYSPEKLK